ncbi:GPP34 family phosphoprotein [Streptomyces sp. NPDC059166]|uniref:GOLPH3/VPS74 family protein n=1 Tax=Streptomyces sp. NPDC059166 TaxID=3346752 RepID=UPI0036A39795
MTLGDELLLLAVGTGRRRPRIRSENRLRAALRASELVELHLTGRIAFGPRRIEVLGTESVEDRRLDNILLSLGRTVPPPSFREWLGTAPQSLVSEYYSRLEDQKALRCRRWRDAAGRTRHDVVSVDVARRRAVVDRLGALIDAAPGTPPDRRDLALAVLVGTADIPAAVYPGVRGLAARRRLTARTAAWTEHLTSAQEAARLAGGGSGAPATHPFPPSGRLGNELADLYSDVTTGGHGLAHSLDSGGWSDGGAGGHAD